MPEIKHQFTGGKMNKDLDERLVPNGEYKDAMNIQVSTSENSDVGTIQNILGNSLVPGQGFIGDGAFCVGSIADEKNDKLYYFISQEPFFESSFERLGEGWYVGTDPSVSSWSFSGNKATGLENTSGNLTYPYTHYAVPEIVEGKHYRITYDVTSASQPGSLILANHTTNDSTLNSTSGSNNVNLIGETEVGTYSVSWLQGSANVGIIRLYNSGSYNGTIDNVKVSMMAGNYIIEYDSKTNSITPVLVDITGDVLQFSSDRLITGINIIDDMLFWTDNYSEPKKINIPRSIQGTDPSGLIHTKFINEDQDISEIDIKEEHITVIKKSPKIAPKIELLSDRDGAIPFSYAGVMRVTDGSQGDGGSSLRFPGELIAPYSNTPPNDFLGLGVGSKLYTFIETDISGESGFTLDWNVGDIVVFKEFEEDSNGNQSPPSIPITDYTIKAKILQSSDNVFADQETAQVQNPSFETPNSSGEMPLHWSGGGPGYPSYDNINHKLSYDGVNASGSWGTVTSGVNWVLGATYKVTIIVSNYFNGYIKPVICAPVSFGSPTTSGGLTGQSHAWVMPDIVSGGTYEHTITLSYNSGSTKDYWGTLTNTILFHSTNVVSGVQAAGMDVELVNVERVDVVNAGVELEILDISGTPPKPQAPQTELKYAVDRLNEQEKLFEFKFPRFAYRYQYQDKEYSNISPFSPIAFLPGSFDYHPKKGYNLGMTNRLDKIKIKDFVKNVPNDVIAIDILYKEEVSPNIYVVDTIKPKHSNLSDGGSIWEEDTYVVKSEILKQVLPSNQILRPWDAVPRKALAQDVTGNRIVYGNYFQNYNLKHGDEDYYPDFNFNISGNNAGLNTVKSIKSLREYQLGVVFIDEYGRETPVATNTSGFSNVTKSQSNKQNKINVAFHNNKFPQNMKYFKFFIKETSGEYYNMAMDRWYDAGDEHVWLSFPSSDRNKIEIDSFLILKKGLESDDLIEETARYRVLAIENEPPDFIKTSKLLIDEKTHDLSSTSVTFDLFGNTVVDAPLRGRDSFKMKYRPFFDSSGSDLHNIRDGVLYVEFGTGGSEYVSNRYKITSITTDLDDDNITNATATYSVKLDTFLSDDVDNIANDSSNPSNIVNGSKVKIYKYVVDNAPKFDGRFFVKVIHDTTFTSNISINNDQEPEFRAVASKKLYYMSSNHIDLHSSAYTGLTAGMYANDATQKTVQTVIGSDYHGAYWDGSHTDYGTLRTAGNTGLASYQGNNVEPCHFGRFAPFFRNYNHKPETFHMLDGDDTTADGHSATFTWNTPIPSPNVDAGQYAFGTTFNDDRNDQPWKFELTHLTAFTSYRIKTRWMNPAGTTPYTWHYDYYSGPNSESFVKFADKHGYNETQRAGIFNDDGEQTHGNVWFIDNGPYVGRRENFVLSARYTQQLANWVTGPLYNGGVDASGGRINFAVNVFHDEIMANYWAAPNTTVGQNAVDSISNFFDIGREGGNTYYDEGNNLAIVNQINSGLKWRFKEDPSGQVYTFSPTTAIHKNLLRFSNNRIPFPLANPSYFAYTASSVPGGQVHFDNSTQVNGNFVSDYNKTLATQHAAGQLSPNYTKGWNMKFKNENDEEFLSWDPTMNDNPGPIDNGLHLSVNATSDPCHAGGFSIINPYIRVANIHDIVDTNTGVKHSLRPGLILESHSNADSGGTFDGNAGKEYLIISKIVESSVSNIPAQVYFTGYQKILTDDDFVIGGTTLITKHSIFSDSPAASQALVFRQPAMNGYSQYSVNRMNQQDAVGKGWDMDNPGILAVGYTIEFLEQIFKEPEMPNNPAIWETEPKDTADLAIYYEASGYNPLVLTEETKHIAIPVGTQPIHNQNQTSMPDGSLINGVFYDGDFPGWYLVIEENVNNLNPLVGTSYINVGDTLSMTKPDGSVITVTVTGWTNVTSNRAARIFIDENLYSSNTSYTLNWHNCYSFGNGVESNRIRDSFNLPFILNGVKVSTVLEGGYKEEHRKYGLIYSGIYNSTSGINNLNQFIMAEKITKEVNPIYGSIQKLHSRDTDLVTLCEDKILRILANKDAVFNADGNTQLTATENVLGQTVPFVGEYGISTNPESFASEAYRAYFTDRVRGSVMRLSKDGLTPISEHGMKDWFRDNLSLGRTNVLGEDALYDETRWDGSIWQAGGQANSAIRNGEAILGYYNNDIHDSRYGKVARLKMNNVLEVGKTYRLQYDIIEHSGLQHEFGGKNSAIAVVNTFSGSGWISGAHGGEASKINGSHINETWVANKTGFELIHFQVNTAAGQYTPPGGITYPITGDADGDGVADYGSVRDYVHAQRIADGAVDSNNDDIPDNAYPNFNYLYGGIVRIKNLTVEEVKEDLKIIGSYDDRQDEYNVTIHGKNSNTVSFKENVKGWVSFKSFTPENALSCANDYYTMKQGKLWQHHSPGSNRNTFYNEFTNSSFNAILNDAPSSIKSYHTLDYEGSQSRVEGIKHIEVTITSNPNGVYSWSPDGKYFWNFDVDLFGQMVGNMQWGVDYTFEGKQYRNNILIYSGSMRAFNNANGIHVRRNPGVAGDFEIGDIITTQTQEDSVYAIGSDLFNSVPTDGWFVSGVETNKEKGSLPEFIEKEGKWFNYIKGVDQTIVNEQIQDYSGLDFGSFEIQGLGIIESITYKGAPNTYPCSFALGGSLNTSVQVGDILYHEIPSQVIGDNIVNLNASYNNTVDSTGSGNDAFIINNSTTLMWSPTVNTIPGANFFSNITTEDLIAGQTYLATLKVSNYTGTGFTGFRVTSGIGGDMRLDQNGEIQSYFVATGGRPDLLAFVSTSSVTMELSIQPVIPGEMLGFTRLDAGQLEKVGEITSLVEGQVEVEVGVGNNPGNPPPVGSYLLFVKNQVVNMNGLSGYYADVMFENNSKKKAELFSVSSEITESSK